MKATAAIGHWRVWRARSEHEHGDALSIDTGKLLVRYRQQFRSFAFCVGRWGVHTERVGSFSLTFGMGVRRLCLRVDPPMEGIPNVNIEVSWRPDVVSIAEEVREYDLPPGPGRV